MLMSARSTLFTPRRGRRVQLYVAEQKYIKENNKYKLLRLDENVLFIAARAIFCRYLLLFHSAKRLFSFAITKTTLHIFIRAETE